MKNELKISIIGLGYVGLPLAVAFGKQFNVIAFDKSEERVSQLCNFHDETHEVEISELKEASKVLFSSNANDMRGSDFFIICVPTPINKNNEPDLSYVESACEIVGNQLISSKHSIVILESTVFPGVTEDICIPILEKNSGLLANKDFSTGYSPERINPGDKSRKLTDIVKVVSGSDADTLDRVDNLYKEIIKAGTYRATSIKVAEAAKAIENTQRDLNIALFNELSKIFHALNIDSRDVIHAASTKWNFIPFNPGLVGGHCIGVDPYYLTYAAKSNGIDPKVILSGRETNDGMHEYIGLNLLSALAENSVSLSNANILMLGATFKENCSDLRNSKAIELANFIAKFGPKIHIYDPSVPANDIQKYLVSKTANNIALSYIESFSSFDAIILAVAHDKFLELISKIKSDKVTNQIIFDLQSFLPRSIVDWRL